jgi:hypothetical protein
MELYDARLGQMCPLEKFKELEKKTAHFALNTEMSKTDSKMRDVLTALDKYTTAEDFEKKLTAMRTDLEKMVNNKVGVKDFKTKLGTIEHEINGNVKHLQAQIDKTRGFKKETE